jgi:rSAM/selenodomain-associated transferase 1
MLQGLRRVLEFVRGHGMRSDADRIKDRALVVVAKEPLKGSVKTRLSPYLSPADAATLYECLLGDIVAKLEKYKESELWLAFAPGGEEYFSQNYRGIRLLAQRGKDLGERLHHVFVDLFDRGHSEIVVADSDSPTVPLSSIDQAFTQLSEHGCDLVLGPSDDGGYYLIGLNRPAERIFHDIEWSTDSVLDRTLERARELAFGVSLLPPAYDIDVEEDLRRLWNDFMTAHDLQELAPRTYDWLRNLLANRSSLVHGSTSSNQAKEGQNARRC